jgi:ElaB/YqjD/DUF883 family membrane-anchored ribosome-binding protein
MTAKSLADQAAEILPAEASERLEEAREGIESLDQRVRQTVAHHPLLCIGGDEAQQLQQSVGEAADAVYAQLADHATQRPYRTLGTAAGIGFVLAGGLTPKVAGLMLSFGSKWLLGRLTDQFMPPSDG